MCAHVGFILLLLLNLLHVSVEQVLTPPTFNLAKGREITATATCGLGVSKPELYCQLTGVVDETEVNQERKGKEIIQVCALVFKKLPNQNTNFFKSG